jgi:hypothetical protein
MCDHKLKSAPPGSWPACSGEAETGGHRSQAVSDSPEAPRRKILEALDESVLQYDELYRRLAQ